MARPPRIPEWLDRALMWAAGATSYDIAAEIGVAQSTVSKQISAARKRGDRRAVVRRVGTYRKPRPGKGGA